MQNPTLPYKSVVKKLEWYSLSFFLLFCSLSNLQAQVTITTEPTAQTVCSGQTATFSVVASGTVAGYQWFKNGATIPGANSSSYTTPANTPANNGDTYIVEVECTCGSDVSSSSVDLTVNEPADINTGSALIQNKCEGENLTLSVGFTGNPAPNFQWKKGAANVGTNSASFSLTNLTAADASSYSVVATNSCGTDSYGPITVAVVLKPTISTQPIGATKCEGETFTASVVASNAGSYQWLKDGNPISDGAAGGGSTIAGANSSTLTISNLCATCNPGTYTVMVTGAGSCAGQSEISNGAVLVINESVSFTTQPLAQTVCETSSVSFSAVGSGTITGYQWYRNGTAISGATNSSYGFTSSFANNGDKYRVDILSPCGSVTSSEVVLTVNRKPVIVSLPVGTTKCEGESYTFSVVASDAGGYQWQKNGVDIAGATSSSYTISNIQGSDAANYKVIVKGANSCNGETLVSTEVRLDVNFLVKITTQPLAQTVCETSSVSFSAVGSGTITGYQWYRNGTAISGATNSSYGFTSSFANNGDKYKVELLGPCGSVTSSEVVLSVNAKPSISLQPLDAAKCAGETMTFQITANNAGSYQWNKDFNPIPNSNSNTLLILNTTAASAGAYMVEVSGAGGCASEKVVSNLVNLTINQPITITTQPVAQTLCESNNALFNVAVTGTNPTYQWYKDGNIINNATSISFAINNTTPDNNGRYKVEIKGTCTLSGVMSSEVVLDIIRIAPPVITTNKPNGMCTGEQTTLTSVGCAGTTTWFRDNNLVATGATFTTNSVGNYTSKCTSLGCTSLAVSNVLSVVQLPELTFTSAIKNVTCFEGGDGEIELTPAGSAGSPFVIAWKEFSTNSTNKISALPTGTYNFSITDRLGCKIDRSLNITQPSKPSVNVSFTDITCFGSGDGKIDFGDGRSDYGGLQFILNNGAPTDFSAVNAHQISSLNKGTYTVSVIDAKKCVVLTPTQVTIAEPAAVALRLVAFKNPLSFESQDGSIQVAVSGGISPYVFKWYNSTGGEITSSVFNLATGSVLSPTDGGIYRVQVKDKNGCENTLTQTLVTPKRIEITTTLDSISCFGKKDGKMVITISGGVTTNTQLPYKTTWNIVNTNGTKEKINADVLSLTNLSPNVYEITATDANDISRSIQFELKDPALLKVTINKIIPNHCASTPLGEATFDIEGGRKPYSVTWNNNTISGNVITKLPNGTQLIAVKDASGCLVDVQAVIPDSTRSFRVAVKYELPTCFGKCDAKLSSTVAGGFTPYQYSWSNIGASTANPINVCGKGESVLTITDNKGCVLRSETVALTSPAPRVLGVAKEKEVCPSKPFELNASAATWGKTFTWTFPNGQTKSGAVIQADSVGTYKITILDENSCGGQDEVVVKQFAYVKQLFTVASQATVNRPVVCIDLTSPVPTSIKWEHIGGTLISQNDYQAKLNFANVGKYKIKELVTVDNCVYTLIKEVEIKESIDNKGFPEPLGFNPLEVRILGNPVNGGRIGLEISNEANEDFTVSLYNIAGNQSFYQKQFVNHTTTTSSIQIEVPPQIKEGAYILTVHTATTKFSTRIFITR